MMFGEAYLAMPDLFPGRLSGERWGEHELSIDFAGGPYLFRGLSTRQRDGLRQRFADLCKLQPEPAQSGQRLEVRVFQAPEHDFLPREPRPWREYSLDLDARPEVVRVAAPAFTARIEWHPNQHTGDQPTGPLASQPASPTKLLAGLWTSVEEPQQDLVGVFENFFRILVAYRLNQLGGALLHSAGVVHEEQAFLFLGPSGAGKSTISRISLENGKTVLSDDMNALRPAKDGVVVEKLPFAGDLGQTATRSSAYPLRGLYRLRQEPQHELHSVARSEALALLVSCAPYLNGDPHRMDSLLANLESLLDRAPLSILGFRLDAEFWSLLEQPA